MFIVHYVAQNKGKTTLFSTSFYTLSLGSIDLVLLDKTVFACIYLFLFFVKHCEKALANFTNLLKEATL